MTSEVSKSPNIPGSEVPKPTNQTNSPRIFCIGFQKTGTTSIGDALECLGYRVSKGFKLDSPVTDEKIFRKAEEILMQHDAAQDTPWYAIYQHLDRWAPGSKFILTARDPDRWIKSVANHFQLRQIPMHGWLYGHETVIGHEDVYLARYLRHNEEVMEYFADRPGDLLVMNFENGDGWEKLCPFLGKPIPDQPFPRKNKASTRNFKKLRRAIQKKLGLEGVMRKRHENRKKRRAQKKEA